MTYIVKDECIKCKLTDCVEVCPVDCFYEGENMLVINPDECIDCGVCEPECPINAIVADTAYNEKDKDKWLGAWTGFDSVTPAYQHATTTSDTVLNNTLITGANDGFTIVTSPNLRVTYSSTETITAFVQLSLATKQASGSNKDVQWALFKNGTEITGSRVIRSLSTGTWGSITLSSVVSLATSDYLEIYSKADGACTVDYASIQLMIQGHS